MSIEERGYEENGSLVSKRNQKTMIDLITNDDVKLVQKLNALTYESLGMTEKVSAEDRKKFIDLRGRLRRLSDFFKKKYDAQFGRFSSENSTGNPVGLDGKLRRVWSGIFKGSENKQYSIQISFVINAASGSLDVGIYFGRASAYRIKKTEREKWESELRLTGVLFASEVERDASLRKRYNELFELGFRAEIRDLVVTPERWLANSSQYPAYSSVVISLYPNTLGYFDPETIDLYVSLVIPFMGVIPEKIGNLDIAEKAGNKPPNFKFEVTRKANPLTPEQWAKRAERLCKIGLDGELYVMHKERTRLENIGIPDLKYPVHTSLVSDSEGYDILTCDSEENEIFIEVKTTTLSRDHSWGNIFFLSSQEFEFYKKNKARYKLYRVWDIENEPYMEEIDLETAALEMDGYKVTIKN
jgi:hypothetical protein